MQACRCCGSFGLRLQSLRTCSILLCAAPQQCKHDLLPSNRETNSRDEVCLQLAGVLMLAFLAAQGVPVVVVAAAAAAGALAAAAGGAFAPALAAKFGGVDSLSRCLDYMSNV